MNLTRYQTILTSSLLLLLVSTTLAFAEPPQGEPPQGPPPEAFAACEHMKPGDEVVIKGPEGREMKGVCEPFGKDQRLAAKPMDPPQPPPHHNGDEHHD